LKISAWKLARRTNEQKEISINLGKMSHLISISCAERAAASDGITIRFKCLSYVRCPESGGFPFVLLSANPLEKKKKKKKKTIKEMR
jgi:hypothetical protein